MLRRSSRYRKCVSGIAWRMRRQQKTGPLTTKAEGSSMSSLMQRYIRARRADAFLRWPLDANPSTAPSSIDLPQKLLSTRARNNIGSDIPGDQIPRSPQTPRASSAAQRGLSPVHPGRDAQPLAELAVEMRNRCEPAALGDTRDRPVRLAQLQAGGAAAHVVEIG